MERPLVSVFTPTNDHKFLKETYQSLRDQLYPNWEWILVPNGENKDSISQYIETMRSGDERVKAFPTKKAGGVGALKEYACSVAKGEILVELDHDDLLANNCLEEITSRYNGTAQFFYSDWSGWKTDGTYEVYDPSYGWEYYHWEYAGQNRLVMKAFPPSARSVAEIFYAPNHVRAWTKKAYDQAGGHNPTLKVADDHDLICRTYISGTDFVYIDKPLYLYRIHDTNTVKLYNKDIQTQQAINFNSYIYQLVYEENRRNCNKSICIGNKNHVFPGNDHFTTEAIVKGFMLPLRLPYEDSSVGYIKAFDSLQMIPNYLIKSLMEEFYRILVPGGWLLTMTPSTEGRGAFQDIRHQSYWNQNSWLYWTDEFFKANYYEGFEDRALSPRFQLVRNKTEYPTEWHKEYDISYVYADLCALKGQRQPGKKS